MTERAVACPTCGAEVALPASVRFATCAHCGTRLTAEGPFETPEPARIQRVQQRTAALEGEIEAVKLQRSLEELDQRWVRFHAQQAADWINSGDNWLVGVSLIPVIGGIVLLFIGLMTVSGAPNLLAVAPGLLLFGAGGAAVAWFGTRMRSRRGAQASYLQEREAILRRLQQLGISAS